MTPVALKTEQYVQAHDAYDRVKANECIAIVWWRLAQTVELPIDCLILRATQFLWNFVNHIAHEINMRKISISCIWKPALVIRGS